MTQAEICRAICDKLEPILPNSVDEWQWHGCHVLIAGHSEKYRPVTLDFYSDEAASAKLFAWLASESALGEIRYGPEEMQIEVYYLRPGEQPNEKNYHNGYHSGFAVDREHKNAVVKAAILYLSIPATIDDNQMEGGC